MFVLIVLFLMFYFRSILLSYFPENLNRLKRRLYKIRLVSYLILNILNILNPLIDTNKTIFLG